MVADLVAGNLDLATKSSGANGTTRWCLAGVQGDCRGRRRGGLADEVVVGTTDGAVAWLGEAATQGGRDRAWQRRERRHLYHEVFDRAVRVPRTTVLIFMTYLNILLFFSSQIGYLTCPKYDVD